MEIRIGINTGEVSRRSTRRPARRSSPATAVNAAARLEQLAEPGPDVVAERTAARGSAASSSTTSANRSCAAGRSPVRAFLLLGETPNA